MQIALDPAPFRLGRVNAPGPAGPQPLLLAAAEQHHGERPVQPGHPPDEVRGQHEQHDAEERGHPGGGPFLQEVLALPSVSSIARMRGASINPPVTIHSAADATASTSPKGSSINRKRAAGEEPLPPLPYRSR
ncbi:hypothetical protein ACQEVF_08965 [Nonomuraea polychroma]|uniref:hypothetical protein n=1 Tax=Nonomuraea polychroma TaxID=46176 RepID=UPI003D8A3E69